MKTNSNKRGFKFHTENYFISNNAYFTLSLSLQILYYIGVHKLYGHLITRKFESSILVFSCPNKGKTVPR